ncbi:MAG TPA: hypothetical protein VG347_15775 [Verrucomicrobiae bacterium]|nr:hypothetical protein [Verrucomicrobiae bacterium]
MNTDGEIRLAALVLGAPTGCGDEPSPLGTDLHPFAPIYTLFFKNYEPN